MACFDWHQIPGFDSPCNPRPKSARCYLSDRYTEPRKFCSWKFGKLRKVITQPVYSVEIVQPTEFLLFNWLMCVLVLIKNWLHIDQSSTNPVDSKLEPWIHLHVFLRFVIVNGSRHLFCCAELLCKLISFWLCPYPLDWLDSSCLCCLSFQVYMNFILFFHCHAFPVIT